VAVEGLAPGSTLAKNGVLRLEVGNKVLVWTILGQVTIGGTTGREVVG
jgi:hypothetical protein